MGMNRYTIAALAGGAALLISGGAAFAGQGDGDRSARCEALLAKIAEKRGVSAEQLQADVKAKLLARIDQAEKAGRISPERAAKLRERISAGTPCKGVRAGTMRLASHGMLKAAAEFLGLDGAALKAQLPGNSLAGLALKQGKSVEDLKAAMLAPAKARLAKLVDAKVATQEQAEKRLERLAKIVDRLVEKTFPAK